MKPLDRTWKEHPAYIRKYYDLFPLHQKLCEEIQLILENGMIDRRIETANISFRVKKLPSFCEKIERKSYEDPFDGLTDLSGVRLVYLFSSNRKVIEKFVEDEFNVIEKVDKIEEIEAEKFGYGAVHYVVKLKDNQQGARYDKLKDLKCEIQIRTILQDAWAVVAHHLSYKNKTDVPSELQRKLYALSGLFETVDDQFELVREKIENYQNDIESKISDNSGFPLDQDINVDSLITYIKWKLPDRLDFEREDISDLLNDVRNCNYATLSSLDTDIDIYTKAVEMYEKDSPPVDQRSEEECLYSAVGFVRGVLRFSNPDYQPFLMGDLREQYKDYFDD